MSCEEIINRAIKNKIMKKQLFKCAMMVYAAMLVSCSSDANLSCDVKKIAADENGVQDSWMLKGTDGSCEVVYTPDWNNILYTRHYEITII